MRAHTNWAYTGQEVIQAVAYDGVQAALVDEMALPNVYPHPYIVTDSRLFVAVPSTNSPPVLNAWKVDTTTGKFTSTSSLPLTDMPQTLNRVSNALVLGYGTKVEAYDIATLTLAGSSRVPGCLWYDYTRADGDISTGIWVPLQSYGVARIPNP